MTGTSLLALRSHILENIYNKIDGNITNTCSLRVCAVAGVVPLVASEFHILRILCAFKFSDLGRSDLENGSKMVKTDLNLER